MLARLFLPGFLVWAVAAAALDTLPAETASFPVALKLERAFPPGGGVELSELSKRDRSRHGRLLQQGVVDFPVEGSYDPFSVGLYFTRVSLGTPPREFYVQIDTGSDILWVPCNRCEGCPRSSGLGLHLDSFDPTESSSASFISCSDEICVQAMGTQSAICSSQSTNSRCTYTFQYGDGSGTDGYYVSDNIHLETVVATDVITNSSSAVIFGCSNNQSGDLTKSARAVDGIFGFGQNDLSVISQLSSRGLAPKVFSHCLRGTDNGGGILVLGEVVEPGIVYTPLVSSRHHYNINLQSIAINGQKLQIDSAVFSTTSTHGTIIDSGTTLAYLAEEAFDPFVNAIIDSVSPGVQSVVVEGNQCFLTSNSVSEMFPPVELNFEGNASMILKPVDYLLQQGSADGATIWCIGWQQVQGQGLTILGDLVLKDKIFVYDLAGQRIGWADYDCSLSVNVSTNTKNSYVNTGQLNMTNSCSLYDAVNSTLLLFLMHLLFFGAIFL